MLRNTKDGAAGCGVVEESPTQLETMLNALRYENHMVRTGGKKGFLKAKNRLATDVIQQLKNSWRNLYGNDSEESVVVLNDGIEFQDASQTAVESQLNENKTTNDHEIFKIFHIVPSVLEGGATAEDLKNTVRFAIQPVVKGLQTAINRYCLLESEKETFSFEIDLDVLDNTDMLSRYQAYEVAVRNGWMQLDEVRYEEGRNPLGLKFIRLGLDLSLIHIWPLHGAARVKTDCGPLSTKKFRNEILGGGGAPDGGEARKIGESEGRGDRQQ